MKKSRPQKEESEPPMSESEVTGWETTLTDNEPETTVEPIDSEPSSLYMPEESKEPKPRHEGDSIFTRIPNGVFQYELLPFFSHPREFVVL